MISDKIVGETEEYHGEPLTGTSRIHMWRVTDTPSCSVSSRRGVDYEQGKISSIVSCNAWRGSEKYRKITFKINGELIEI